MFYSTTDFVFWNYLSLERDSLCSICFKHALIHPNARGIPLFCLLCSVHVLISHLRLTTGWVMVSGVLALALVNAQDCLHVV